jgi:basic membrane lipoprotein Med (substrate-binding protein (PBP1-ABC) superfamily)
MGTSASGNPERRTPESGTTRAAPYKAPDRTAIVETSMPTAPFARLLMVLAVLALAAGIQAADKPFQVGLILAGSATDGGWNQLAKEGMETVAKTLGAKLSVVQKVSGDKAGDELRDYAANGFDLVIAHGYEFLNPAAEVAKTAPATRIAVSGADVEKPGIVTLDFDLSQASYQVGILAGKLSKTGKLGFIGGAPFPSVKACYRGFLAGARSVAPGIAVVEAYTSWDQPAQSKAQAEAFFAQGIDVVYHDVDAASRGIFEAVKERNAAKGAGAAWVFGSVANQNANPVCPEATPASAVILLDQAFLAVAKSVKDGSFKPGVRREDIALGTCVIALNPTLVGKLIPADWQQLVSDAGRKLASGELVIPAQ